MTDKALHKLTLATWAATVWEKELRGIPLQHQEASLAYCMRQHAEWRNIWNNLNTPEADTQRTTNILVHIYNDAAVRLQLDRKDPVEITTLYDSMRAKGFADIDALHALAYVMQEQTWNAKTTDQPFDMPQYVERAKRYVETVIEHPELIKTLRTT